MKRKNHIMQNTTSRLGRMLIVVTMFAAFIVTSVANSPAQAAPIDCSRGINLSFEDPVITSNWTIVPATPGWFTTDKGIEIWKSGFNKVLAPDGKQLSELQGNNNSANWQDIPTFGGDEIEWSFYHRGRQDNDTVVVRLGSTGTQTDEGTYTTGTEAFEKYGKTYVVPDGQTTTRFVLDPVDRGSVGNLVDLVEFALTCEIGLETTFTGSTDTDGSGTVTVGDVYDFSYVVTNLGTATLASIDVAEGLGDTVTCDDATLVPGASTQCSASHSITQPEIDAGAVESSATASGTDAAGVTVDASDVVSVAVDQLPAVSVEKQGAVDGNIVSPAGRPDEGDAIDYSFLVTNNGNVTLSDIQITDPLIDSVVCPDTPLAPGDSHTCSGTYTLQQDDIDLGSVDNTATVSATPPVGDPVGNTDSVTVTIDQVTSLDISKTATSSDYDTVGEKVSYEITVVNTGNVELVNVSVNDPNADDGSIACTPTIPSSLLPGATLTCAATHTVTQEDLDSGSITNVASAAGVGRLNDVTASDDSDSVVVEGIQNHDLEFSKAAESTPVGDGTFLTKYTLTVANTGNVTAENVQMTDDLVAVFGDGHFAVDTVTSATLAINPGYDGADDINLLVGDDDLAPGASAVVILDVIVDPMGVAGAFRNVATVLSEGVQQTNEWTDVADVAFDVAFDLTIDKTANASAAPGDNVTWTLVVGNAGPSAVLGPITVTDTLDDTLEFVSGGGDGWSCAHAHGTVSCTSTVPLASGTSSTIEIVTTVNAQIGDSITNSASVVSADASNESDPSNNVDSATVDIDSLPMTGFETTDVAGAGLASIIFGLMLLIATSRSRRRQTEIS